MKYLRLCADEAGESHVEEVEATLSPTAYAPPAPPFEVSQPVAAARYVMVRFPAGWRSDLHPSPHRQLFVVLSGELEGGVSDGSTVTLGAGDALLMEDTTGKGHTAKVNGRSDVLGVIIHLE